MSLEAPYTPAGGMRTLGFGEGRRPNRQSVRIGAKPRSAAEPIPPCPPARIEANNRDFLRFEAAVYADSDKDSNNPNHTTPSDSDEDKGQDELGPEAQPGKGYIVSDKPHARERGNPQVIYLILPGLNQPSHGQASTASRPIDARLLLIDRLQI